MYRSCDVPEGECVSQGRSMVTNTGPSIGPMPRIPEQPQVQEYQRSGDHVTNGNHGSRSRPMFGLNV